MNREESLKEMMKKDEQYGIYKELTAVEWLIDWMGKNQYFIGNDLLQAVGQAKKMEKEQIIDAHECGYTEGILHSCESGEQYYNERFNK